MTIWVKGAREGVLKEEPKAVASRITSAGIERWIGRTRTGGLAYRFYLM
jgi:hypothetical protein